MTALANKTWLAGHARTLTPFKDDFVTARIEDSELIKNLHNAPISESTYSRALLESAHKRIDVAIDCADIHISHSTMRTALNTILHSRSFRRPEFDAKDRDTALLKACEHIDSLKTAGHDYDIEEYVKAAFGFDNVCPDHEFRATALELSKNAARLPFFRVSVTRSTVHLALKLFLMDRGIADSFNGSGWAMTFRNEEFLQFTASRLGVGVRELQSHINDSYIDVAAEQEARGVRIRLNHDEFVVAYADQPPSAPAVPASAALTDGGLPLEIWHMVGSHLLNGADPDAYRTVASLSALSKTSFGMRNVVTGNGVWQLDARCEMIYLVNEFVRQTPGPIQLPRGLFPGRLLAFMTPDHRERLVAEALGNESTSPMVKELVGLGTTGLAYLSKAQRNRLIDAAICIDDPKDRARALAGLAAGLAYLNEAQQNRLIDAAIGTNRVDCRTEALAALGAGLAYLNEDQHKRLLDGAMGIDVTWYRGDVLGALSGLARFSKTHLPRFLDAAIRIIDSFHLGEGLLGLGREFAHLDEIKRGRLVNAVLNIRDAARKATALAALGPALAYLDGGQHCYIVDAAIGLSGPEHRAIALAGLGAWLADLSEEPRRRVVDAVIGIGEASQKAKALAALGPGLAPLGGDQHRRVVDAAIGLSDPEHRARTLARLGAWLGNLSEDQRGRVVDAAIGIFDPACRTHALAGLGAGLAHLTEDQLRRIVDAAIGISEPWHQAIALTGLGARLANLVEAQRVRVVDAVIDIGEASPKAKALAALSSGLAYLDEEQQRRIVDAVLGLRDATQKAEGLAALARSAYLGKAQRERVVQAARVGLESTWHQARVLDGLIAALAA